MLRNLIFTLALTCLAVPSAQADEFRNCLAQVRGQAISNGVTPETFDAATASLEPDPSVLEAMQYQPEFKTPIWD